MYSRKEKIMVCKVTRLNVTQLRRREIVIREGRSERTVRRKTK